jgi:YbbR domain-containing protein
VDKIKEKNKGFLQNLNSELKKIDRRIIIFMIFVGISSVLWLMNSLSKDYITEIDCPIEFYNYPDNYVMIDEIPGNVKLQVSGRGFTLLKYTIGSIALPFNIDLQSYFSTSDSDSKHIQFQYYMSSKKEEIERFLNDEIKVLDVSPSILSLKFDKLHEKKVKISSRLNLKYTPQYRQKGYAKISPDSVIVKGPKSVLDTMNEIYTEIITDQDINSNQTYKVKLKSPDRCNLSIKEAKVKVNVEQFTENTIEVPINIINKPDTLSLSIFPDKIKITYLVSFQNFQIVKPSDFHPAIDYREISSQNDPQELKVTLLYIPEEVQVTRYWPQKARFIIKEK